MKILFIAPSLYMSERFSDMIYAPRDIAVDLVDGLVAAGHDVTFATAPDVETSAGKLEGDAAYLDLITAATPPHEHFLIKRDYEIDLLARAFRLAQAGKFDIIHVFAVTAAHYFEQFANTPVVYTIHDPVPQTGTLGGVVFEKFQSHRFISISTSQKKGTKDLNFVATVYHSINPAKYPFVGKPEKRWVFVGRLVPEKGLEDAIKAAVVTNTKLIAASDWNAHRGENDQYKAQLAMLLSTPLVEQVGVVSQSARAKLLGRGKALLFPIKWEEPFGMVMIEAMACGTPVVAYDRGSVSEVVKDGVTGFVVPPDKGIEGLIAAMKRIGEIDRSACRKHVEDHFSIHTMVARYEDVYRKVISTP